MDKPTFVISGLFFLVIGAFILYFVIKEIMKSQKEQNSDKQD